MDLSKLSLFNSLTRRMRWLGERQSVIADNIANANTPNFKARDLKPLEFRHLVTQSQAQVTPVRTNPAHKVVVSQVGFDSVPKRIGSDVQATPTGNTVVAETEILKVAETMADYQLMTNLYTKHLAMLKTALGRGG